jgi:hypothetical protein
MAMNFSISDALGEFCKSALEWNARLNELNGQIANRQLELTRLREEETARFTEKDRLPTRSLKNKDSTEPLQPKDGNENPSISGDPSNADDAQIDPFDLPNLHENGSAAPAPRLSSSTTSPKPGMVSILPLGSRLVSLINRMSAYLSRNFKLFLLGQPPGNFLHPSGSFFAIHYLYHQYLAPDSVSFSLCLL